ncbi:hypothetical protein J4E82_011552 [Alternaria postmessia]|uniref:uncharacterized protein n=1 Tax=Alternaria postmessia TaxID=1187938 RepID=UPI0022259B65|nr:uncharacterized protein J4E82_011552 [Alternaria postmessia]KAI5364332.1 hypothetical protein J4E82_011552 [Alternaria postmessia]
MALTQDKHNLAQSSPDLYFQVDINPDNQMASKKRHNGLKLEYRVKKKSTPCMSLRMLELERHLGVMRDQSILLKRSPTETNALEVHRSVLTATCMLSAISTNVSEYQDENSHLKLRQQQTERFLKSKDQQNKVLLAALQGVILDIGVGHCNQCGMGFGKGSPWIMEKCGAVSEL